MKELGVGMMVRMMAKRINPRLIITESNGKWTLRTETTIRTVSMEFYPDTEFEEVTPDGRKLKVRMLC